MTLNVGKESKEKSSFTFPILRKCIVLNWLVPKIKKLVVPCTGD